MQAILDHLTAILVGATLLGALVFIQMRQQQSAIETTVHGRAQEHAGSFFDVSQREMENARTRTQSIAGLGYYVMEIDGSPTRTDRFTFVTSEPPPPGSAPTVTNTIKAVSYRLQPTGNTVRVGTVDRPTYRVERWTNQVAGTTAPDDFTLAGVMATDVVSFVIRAFDKDEQPVTWASTSAGYGRPSSTSSSDDPVRFEIEIETAARGPEQRTGDQAATSQQNLVSLSQSIRPVNVGASGSSTVTGPTAPPRELPLLPGEPTPPTPPPPPPPSPTPTPTPPTPTPTPSPSPPPAPPPAPPPRPTPPPGTDI